MGFGSGNRRPAEHRLSRCVLSAALVLVACNPRPDVGTVVVSAIGDPPQLSDPARKPLGPTDRLLIDTVAQGLVRFDAAGQVEQGLAERWIVIDGGMSYIFRLRDAQWSDGQAVTAEEVVAALTRQLRRGTRNRLAGFLTAIDEIVVMTPQVIEVRLKRPRPDLLKLFAQPEMAVIRARPPSGSGPMRIAAAGSTWLLRPAADPARAEPDDDPGTRPEHDVRLIGERAARAIVRFARHRSDLVTGGTFIDRPLLDLADIAQGDLRTDPAVGLFGLAVFGREGFLADPANRAALSGAIDRAALVAAVLPGVEAADRVLPETLDSAAPPQVAAWTLLSLEERQADARRRVVAAGAPVTLRIALPAGPGATRLFGLLGADLLALGITPVRVDIDQPAELGLVDAVAPYDSARWYLQTACDGCDAPVHALLDAARDAPTLAERSQHIAEADAALQADGAFIPLARPLRWSLVAQRLRQWTPNPRAWHPLNRLRNDTN